ncbi:unnamed protein product [Clonostachys rosea]|uniref:Invertebrate defensins family profile domain-containing protein n=1 Tax=Bionectria ochroleuca TaxID=29856 RepID=A0ABY6U260_BIOOC|nr:unnamed protein product [Clonostachys rosea]
MKFTSSVLVSMLSMALMVAGSPTPDNNDAIDDGSADIVDLPEVRDITEAVRVDLEARGQGCPFGNQCNLHNVHRTCNGKLQYPYKGSCGGFANLVCQCYYHKCTTT